MKKHFLQYAEIYITNVCNLSCTECNRFNNYAFSGHQKWNDYKESYAKWADRLDIFNIGIVGGEPFTNPDIKLWIDGIASLWPEIDINIITNGTQLDKVPDLYAFLKRYQGRVKLSISEHETDCHNENRSKLLEMLVEPCMLLKSHDSIRWRADYNNNKQPDWPDCAFPYLFYNLDPSIQNDLLQKGIDPECYTLPLTKGSGEQWVDKNGVRISYVLIDRFYKSAVTLNDDNRLVLHSNDPDEAMENCAFTKCPHFIEGKLYKCGPVGLFPKFDDQFRFEISDQDRNLIHSYVPAEPDWSDQDLELFLDNQKTKKSIPQCKFCPTKRDNKTIRHIDPRKKKPTVVKFKRK